MLRRAILLVLLLQASKLLEASVHLNPSTLPARGKQEAVLTVDSFGRYSVAVKSKQGIAIQVVDRMTGPGEIYGRAGYKDGRLDVFLERGQYKIITYAHEQGAGKASVEVHSFNELNVPVPPLLVEFKQIEQTLADLQQRSFWFEIKEARPVAFRAAGRNLEDLRIWKDGTWLVDAAPRKKIAQPLPGTPLQICYLSTLLQPGLYLLTAYGGPPQPWSESSSAHPMYLQYGIPGSGEAGRRRFEISPFGEDYWLVPGKANYFRLETPKATEAELQLDWFQKERAFELHGERSQIHKNSALPAVEILSSSDSNRVRLVRIAGEPGQPYVLQQFEALNTYTFQEKGSYWLSTIHSGHAADSIDATGILSAHHAYEGVHRVPAAFQVIDLDDKTTWSRKFNLLSTVTLFLQIRKEGKYQVITQGTETHLSIDPFLTNPAAIVKSSRLPGNGSTWELAPGFYVLSISPQKAGVITAVIRPASLIGSLLETIGSSNQAELNPVRASIRFNAISLDPGLTYTLHMNEQSEVKKGIILKKLPLDLNEPLFLSLLPGEIVTIPAALNESGTLRALSENGKAADVSLDGALWDRSWNLVPGAHSVRVRNSGHETTQLSLFVEPLVLQKETPLPFPNNLTSLPTFPSVSEGSRNFRDIDDSNSTTFIVNVDRPGFFQLQSTGLLATAGTLRTRINPAVLTQSQNGTGRNFLIQQYLREGVYQVTVKTVGRSKGHSGMELVRTKLVEGGELLEGTAARATVRSGEAILYTFTIRETGEYALRSFGMQRSSVCRLEDEDGWPVLSPNIPAEIQQYFSPGRYRFMVLPEALPGRKLTLLQRIRRPIRLEGHGPHTIETGEMKDHEWLESKKGAARVPDVWRFSVTAPANTRIHLTNEMHGTLYRRASTLEKTAYVPPERGWHGRLETGDYQLEATCVRRNNQVIYRLEVTTDELIPGSERSIHPPQHVMVSAGTQAFVELASFGSGDVKAQLRDLNGEILAVNDDRPDDWNFRIARNLLPGQYRLSVFPVGAETAEVTVSMRIADPKTIESPDVEHPFAPQTSLSNQSALSFFLKPEPASVNLADETAEAVVALVRTSAGQPGIRFDSSLSAGAMSVGSNSAIAAAFLPVPGLKVWSAGTDVNPLEARLLRWNFHLSGESMQLQNGVITGTVRDPKAQSYTLPAGAKQVTVSLEDGLVGVFTHNNVIRSIHWSDEPLYQESVVTEADHLILFHIKEGADQFSIGILPSTDAALELKQGFLFQQKYASSGTFRLQVSHDGSAETVLKIRGAESVVWIGDNGKVLRGSDTRIQTDGTAIIEHGPGPVIAWLDSGVGSLWNGSGHEVATLELPATIPLSGPVRSFELLLRQGEALHVRTTFPVVTMIEKADTSAVVEMHENGCDMETYPGAGKVRLTLRALGNVVLSGQVELRTSNITNIVEGRGPQMLLPSGATRFFSLDVLKDARIGIGIRSSSARVDVRLLDSSGKTLGEGPLQMHNLKTGTYILAVHRAVD